MWKRWKQGLKTLYYCRSEKLGKADRISKRIEREVIKGLDMEAMVNNDECIACEGNALTSFLVVLTSLSVLISGALTLL